MSTFDLPYTGFRGRLTTPDLDAPAPGVLVIHDGFGWGQHAFDRSEMLAELGYVAYAADLFGEGVGREGIQALADDNALFRSRLADALAVLAARPEVDGTRLAAIGWCFGGRAVLELARAGADLRAVVSFHGGLTTTEVAQAGAVRASVLVCTGAEDPYCLPEERTAFEREMTEAGAEWQLIAYSGAQHGFANPALTEGSGAPPGVAWHETADRRSWAAMASLFRDVMG